MDTEQRAERQLVVLALAGSAGLHAGLVPAHASEGFSVAALFAVAAIVLGALAVWVDRTARRIGCALTVAVLAALLVLYACSRVTTVWPLEHAEPIDALGAVTKLIEAAGLVLAVRLLHHSVGSARELPAQHQGAGP